MRALCPRVECPRGTFYHRPKVQCLLTFYPRVKCLGPRVECPGGHFNGGTLHPMTPESAASSHNSNLALALA